MLVVPGDDEVTSKAHFLAVRSVPALMTRMGNQELR